jgi:formyltetrahydrofolate-dependent phosphoribosylglycinamide formyltransferase
VKSGERKPHRPRLAVLLSGSGRTLQNLIDRIADGRLHASIAGVGSNRADAFGLQRALDHGLEARTLANASATWSWIAELDVDLVVLAGYLRLLPIEPDFAGRVLNIHPSLLPRHGGKGMHGERVHEAVLAAGDKESGCTVHLCDDRYDEGRLLLQARVPVLAGDSPTTLAARVFAAECEAYPAGIALRWRELCGR